MAAYTSLHLRLARRSRRVRWSRLPLAATVVASVTVIDTSWKAAALAAGHSAAAMDAPTTVLKPFVTMLVGLAALAGALMLPRLCVPGALLLAAGVSSNILSLGLWRAVPDPFAVHLAGGILHFNLADLCVTSGCTLFLAAVLWTLWRMPDERFAGRYRSSRGPDGLAVAGRVD